MNTYTNPILNDLADPDVFYEDGIYYLYGTIDHIGPQYGCYTSTNLVDWKWAGIVLEPGAFGMDRWFWAPAVTKYRDKYLMLCSVNEQLGLAEADSPLGPFIPRQLLFDHTIDGGFLTDSDGTLYIYYVTWREGHTYGIWGCRMKDDLTPDLSSETYLFSAEHEWEKQMAPVNEAPQVLLHNGRYIMTYSACDYRSKDYAVGMASADHPLGPYNKYEGNPILRQKNGLYGTGHHAIVRSPDGRGMYILYHAHKSAGEIHPRNLCLDPIAWEGDVLVTDGPSTAPQPVPEA